ncbi:tetratricopeptide repeat protein [Nonomuraea fuscirosea]|uniref:AfsR/SARP family transcriptional regulator n=1 Tax=Nonomuraea fuscirosea TaxID=1291556 RepID=UPI002DD9AF8A|nr:BTAD domain-containing putative transcriptional regulator [Nonomuraea fuscirosea]WSA52753.1 tetratricopeptide repeat protein [Nonomuraea fuscirosea]
MRVLAVELLGPLRVSVSGLPVELPPARQRALLAVLAMSAGRAVPAEKLVSAVWGADPRGDPRANLRTTVKRVRRALGTAELIAARPGGYLLAAEPDQVDALRFGHLVDEAAAASDPAAERSRLAEALALWRGTPFDGIRSDWLEHFAAPALHDRYLSALERRVDLDLAHGTRPDPAPLARAADRHPLRESLWARLLRVLESSGRPAEALERYETIRRRLAAELGVDPSPELRQVHADLLTAGAPAAGRTMPGPTPAAGAPVDGRKVPSRLPAADAPAAGSTVPSQLPAAVIGFAGREAELAALDALLGSPEETRSPAPSITVISGTAGIGKTTLAVHWAHRVADRFPDGRLHVDLRGYDPSGEAVRPATAVRALLDALEVPPHRIPDGLDAQTGLYRSLLAGRRMLVLLDNARDAGQVTPLLPGAPGCLVLVTSRDHLTELVMTYGARPLPLGLLPPDEARRLLSARLGQERLTARPDAVEQIVRRCAGLPLALAIVAARAAIHPAHPLDALATELRDTLGALDRVAGVRAIFSWSYDSLGDAAARLFRLVAGLHPGPDSTIAAAASLAGLPISEVRAPLAELTSANLLTEPVPGRWSCHDLLRAYASELCQAHDADRDAARRRLIDHYARTAYAAHRLLGGDAEGDTEGGVQEDVETVGAAAPATGVCVTDLGGRDAAAGWFAAERPALLAVLEQAADLGLDRQVCHLARAMFVFLHGQGFWHDRAETQQAAVAAAVRLGDPVEESRAYRNLAFALADLGRFDDAHHNLDAALHRARDDLAGQAWTHYHRDIVYALQGRQADALDAARRAHDLFERLDHQAGRAIALTDLGFHHGRLGHHARALELCEQALLLHQRLGNRPHEAHTWSCLADTRLQLGDPAGAVPCYRRALGLFREFGDPYAEASTLAHLGACHHLAGDHPAAHEHWRHAHTLLGDRDSSATDQIHTQLAIIDRSAADAFRHRR